MSTDAIVVLKDDHQKIRKLFRQFQAAGENATATKGRLARQILELLTVHTYLENEVMYPQVRTLSERDMIFIKNALTRYQNFPNNAHYNVVVDLSSHVAPLLQLDQSPGNRVEFLKTLLRDYIVLTR